MSNTYIKLSTKEYPRHIGDIEADPAGMADYAEVVWVEPPQIDRSKQRLSPGEPTLVDGQWLTNWVVSDIPAEQLAKKIRSERNRLLAATDWTQLSDAPDDKAAWAAYRQGLRDISKQATFPSSVTWPEAPGVIQTQEDPSKLFTGFRR